MTDPEATAPPVPAQTTSILPAARTDLPDDAPWWAKYLAVKIGQGWKLLSVNVPVLLAALIEADQASGGQLEQLLPETWRPHVAAAALAATALLRFVNQSKEKTP